MTRDSTPTPEAEGDDAVIPLHVLARAAQRGRRRARDRFARRIHAVVKVVVRRQLASNLLREAEFEDVVQEALLKIATELPGLEVRDEASLHQWINTLIANVIHNLRDYERAEKRDPSRRRSLHDLPAEATDGESPVSTAAEPPAELVAQGQPLPEIVSDRELFARALAALGQLSPDEAHAVRRVELEGESIAAVARELSLGESTIRQRLARGLARIGAHLAGRSRGRNRGDDPG